MDRVRSGLKQDSDSAKARLRAAAEDIEILGFVRRRPFTSVMLALAAGFAVGWSPTIRRTLRATVAGAAGQIFRGRGGDSEC